MEDERFTLSKEEMKVLRLSPKYQIYSRLEDQQMETDFGMMATKYRWEWRRREDTKNDELINEEIGMTKEERDKFEIAEGEARVIFNQETERLDFTKKRVTDCKDNSRIYMPKGLSTLEEAKLALRTYKLRECYQEYKSKECGEKGDQRTNLSHEQKAGLDSLMKRIKKGELMIGLTDKTGKLAVMSRRAYLAMGAVHTAGDEKVNQEKIRGAQRLLNAHVSMWLKALGHGQNWGHSDRFRETMINHSEEVAPLDFLIKDHKKVKPGELPKTRPVVGGNQAMGRHLSEILSEIVEALATLIDDSSEVISTEDMIAHIEEYNKMILSGDVNTEDLMLLGADVVALFPFLEVEESAEEVMREFIDSKLEKDNVDWKEISKYLAMNI